MLTTHHKQSQLDLSSPKIMGILNLTPDSFSDGGLYCSLDSAVRRAEQMTKEGAALIDIGGESSRPGSQTISVQQELDRVMPTLEKIHKEIAVPISVDTCKPQVMRAALAAGASMINDINALQSEDALQVIKNSNAWVCLMHKQGDPYTMQQNPQYQDVITEVYEFLQQRIQACLAAGIAREKIIIDPGFGFGKTAADNLSLLKNLERLQTLQCPLLVGWSRKTTLGEVLQQPVNNRLYGSLAAAALAVAKGAVLIRAHDVKETVDAINFTVAVMGAR